jgi:alkanesulfonate monooxygenase SsuD/methylene tetrahydromethanopterin reductase-like flavin-dependent oxidoreductase (luciferase family)
MFRRERETLQKLVLVPYRPFRNLSLGIGGVILIIAAAVGGFYAGSRYGISTTGATPEEVQRLRQTVRMYADRSQAMRDKAAVALHDRSIVLDATEQLRQDNKNLLASMTALEEQVALYKRLLSPKGVSQGLNVERFDLQSTGKPGVVQYRLLLTQVSNKTTEITGRIEARLVAEGRTMNLPVGDGRFSFQYFQSLTGEWQMPGGMTPERVDIVLTPAKGPRIQKSFKWEVLGQG